MVGCNPINFNGRPGRFRTADLYIVKENRYRLLSLRIIMDLYKSIVLMA
jgi:hypothetical protein